MLPDPAAGTKIDIQIAKEQPQNASSSLTARSTGDDDTDDDGDTEWRRADSDEGCGEDGDSDDAQDVVGVGIVGDTDWRERAARARREQRRRVASARPRGKPESM